MPELKFSLVLGSGSQERVKLLEKIHITPTQTFPPDIAEIPLKKELPHLFADRMAEEKMMEVLKNFDKKKYLIITADTIAACGRRILQKPLDSDQAESFLHLLSGRRHRVYTAVCLSAPDREKPIIKRSLTTVRFKHLHQQEITRFIANKEWQGKSGGYGIQGLASSFIEWVSGSYTSVAGLPLCLVNKLLLPYIKN